MNDNAMTDNVELVTTSTTLEGIIANHIPDTSKMVVTDLSEFLTAIKPYLENERLNSIGLQQLGGLVVCFKDELLSAAPTPDIPEKALTTIKFHSKGGGFIRLKNELGHLFDVTVPPEKVDVEKLKLEVISYLDTHVGFINFGVYHEKDECMLVIGHTIDHLAAAGYLREPQQSQSGDVQAALDAESIYDAIGWLTSIMIELRKKPVCHIPNSIKIEQTIRAALTAQQTDVNQELLKALKKADYIFRDYERIHLSKSPPDRAKAKANGEYAYEIEQAIAKAEGK